MYWITVRCEIEDCKGWQLVDWIRKCTNYAVKVVYDEEINKECGSAANEMFLVKLAKWKYYFARRNVSVQGRTSFAFENAYCIVRDCGWNPAVWKLDRQREFLCTYIVVFQNMILSPYTVLKQYGRGVTSQCYTSILFKQVSACSKNLAAAALETDEIQTTDDNDLLLNYQNGSISTLRLVTQLVQCYYRMHHCVVGFMVSLLYMRDCDI